MNLQETKTVLKKQVVYSTKQYVKSIDSVFLCTYNTRINDDNHTTKVITSFSDRESALDWVVEMNVEERKAGNYNWYSFIEVEVN